MTETETTRLVARTPEDLIAMVPAVLGFTPAESVTMLTFDAVRAFHARIDLPDGPRGDGLLLETLLAPSLRHGVGRVAFVVHSRRPDRFAAAARRLVDGFVAAGIDVVDALRADGRRAWCLDCDRPATGTTAADCPGHAYDVGAHRFAAQAVVAGRVVHPSREALAATLQPSVEQVGRHRVLRDAAYRHARGLGAADLPREGRWMRRAVRRQVAAGRLLADPALARLLADLGVVALRDDCWERLDRTEARDQVELWCDVVRRAPDDLVAPAAGVLGFAAWLAGDGALAWCAVDRGRAHEPGLDLLGYVADLLSGATPPTDHRPRRRSDGPPSGREVA